MAYVIVDVVVTIIANAITAIPLWLVGYKSDFYLRPPDQLLSNDINIHVESVQYE